MVYCMNITLYWFCLPVTATNVAAIYLRAHVRGGSGGLRTTRSRRRLEIVKARHSGKAQLISSLDPCIISSANMTRDTRALANLVNLQ